MSESEETVEYEINPHTGEVVKDYQGFPVPKGKLYLICDRCNYDQHTCPGCGDYRKHWESQVCDDCKAEADRQIKGFES